MTTFDLFFLTSQLDQLLIVVKREAVLSKNVKVERRTLMRMRAISFREETKHYRYIVHRFTSSGVIFIQKLSRAITRALFCACVCVCTCIQVHLVFLQSQNEGYPKVKVELSYTQPLRHPSGIKSWAEGSVDILGPDQ